MLNDFVSLIYPNVCLACGAPLVIGEECICLNCHHALPKTGFHLQKDNPLARVFWGRIDLVAAAAYFYFTKGEKVQHLLHQLKYNGQAYIGIYFGKLFGRELMKTPDFQSVNYIIPVPLHPKKLRKRGYNQSEMIGLGLAETMNAELDCESLYRTVATETQTRKSRFSRWENVKSIFAVKNIEKLSDKHIVIVDDVITTGSTIESCAMALQAVPGIKISVVSLAVPIS